MRFRGCKHQWEFVGAKFNPPPDGIRKVEGNDRELVREGLYGVTVLTQQCIECGWIETSRVAGKADLSKFGSEWLVERQGVGG